MAKLQKHLTIANFKRPVNLGMAMSSKIILDNLDLRYLTKIEKDIKMTTYLYDDNYVFNLKVPSEKNKDMIRPVYYDTIIEFYPITKVYTTTKSIRDYGMRVFSNCPTFMFGFTNLYNKMGSLYKLPKGFYAKQALSEAANITNPMKLTGVEKSIYYSIKYISNLTNLNKNRIKVLAKNNKLDIKDLHKIISTQEEKITERTLIDRQTKERERIKKAKAAKKKTKKKITIKKRPLKSKLSSFTSKLKSKSVNTFTSKLKKK